jgi:hypothetical protein
MRGNSEGRKPRAERRLRAEIRKASIALLLTLRLFAFARYGLQASSSHISAADISALGSTASASEQMES